MYTRIGPSRTGDDDFVVEQLLDGLLQRSLDCGEIGLDLPTVKVCTVVGQRQLEVPHRIGYSIPVHAARAISATIITRNEEDRIAGAIKSLSCCDEVIVVDAE